MIDLKRFFLERKREIVVALLSTALTTTLTGCAKHEETIPDMETEHKGAYVFIDEETNEMKVVEDNTITGMRVISK